MKPEQDFPEAVSPLLEFRMIRVDVVQTGERKDRHPDLLGCDVPGGMLLAIHGVKRGLTFLPGVSYDALLEATLERAQFAAMDAESEGDS